MIKWIHTRSRRQLLRYTTALLTMVAAVGIAVWAVGRSTLPTELERLVVLDPGHGNDDPGCIYDSVYEKDINLQIALLLRTELKQRGYQVKMTRDDDKEILLKERAARANRRGWNSGVYVSLHVNSTEETDTNASGVEVWHHETTNALSENLANQILEHMTKQSGVHSRGRKTNTTFYVTREVLAPSCLVEMGFINNASDRNRMTAEKSQRELAEKIADGIDAFFTEQGVTQKEEA